MDPIAEMFGFDDMADNYEDRRIARYYNDDTGLMVSTARVTDGQHPIETAVAHSDYNDADIVIVAVYDDEAKAQHGHDEWVKKMTTEPLPAQLTDIQNAQIAQLINPKDLIFERKPA